MRVDSWFECVLTPCRPLHPAAAAARLPSSGTPPRGASTDPRLADMPDGLSQSEVSNYIKDKCKLDDPMWAFVDAISKKGANVRWACKVCEASYTGAPQKIRAHFLSALLGCATCDVVGELRDKANEAAQKHLDNEVRKREEKEALKKRKQQVAEAERAAKARKVQGRIDSNTTPEYSRAHLGALWAKACYAAPFAFGLLENEFVREAVEATSLFHAPESSKRDSENLPVYQLPKRHEQGCVQMGRYWEVEADHEGPVPCTVPVRAGCGASGRRERATRVGSANGRREWTARVGGASGRCSRVARKRSCADGTVLGKFRPQAPLGRLGDWGTAPRPHLGAWGGRMVAWVAMW